MNNVSTEVRDKRAEARAAREEALRLAKAKREGVDPPVPKSVAPVKETEQQARVAPVKETEQKVPQLAAPLAPPVPTRTPARRAAPRKKGGLALLLQLEGSVLTRKITSPSKVNGVKPPEKPAAVPDSANSSTKKSESGVVQLPRVPAQQGIPHVDSVDPPSGVKSPKGLTVKQLKDELRKLGLPVGGLKAELIERLENARLGNEQTNEDMEHKQNPDLKSDEDTSSASSVDSTTGDGPPEIGTRHVEVDSATDDNGTVIVNDVHDLKVGQKLQGTVTGVRDIGAFIDIGIANLRPCLLRNTRMANHWVNHPKEILKRGEKVDVWVYRVTEQEQPRIGLSLLQTERTDVKDPVTALQSASDSEWFRGVIQFPSKQGIFVDVLVPNKGGRVQGIVRWSDTTDQFDKERAEDVKSGIEIDIRIVNVNMNSGTATLTMKQLV